MPDNRSVAELNAIISNALKVIDIQRQQIEAYVSSIGIIGNQLLSLHADTKITKVAVSVLLKDLANGDKEKLDRLLALSVALAEERVSRLRGNIKDAILGSIDELIFLTETKTETDNHRN